MAGKHQFTSRELAALIIPLIADSFLSILIGMADTIMVARCGEAAVSGVSLVDSISNLLITVFSAFATGGAVVISQYLGHKEDDNAKASAVNLIYISAAISLLMTLVILPIRGHVIDFLFGSIEEDVRLSTDEYFVPILLSYPFLAVYSAMTAISRAERKSFRTMAVSAMMNAINIGGNAMLIYHLGLGPRGAGIASLASRVAGCMAMLIMMINRNEDLNIRGLPINAVANNYNGYANIPGNGLNLAMITIVGQCRGQNNIKDVRYYTWLLFGLVFIATFIVNIPLFIFSPQVISFYGLQDSSLSAAIPICRLCLVMCTTIWPFAFTLPNMLKAVGDVKYILFASFSSMWIFRVGGAYTMVKLFGMGIEGVWYAMYLDWLCRGILYFWRIRSGKWETKNVI